MKRRALIGLLLAVAAPVLASAAPPPSVRIERLDSRFDTIVSPQAEVTTAIEGIEWAEGPLWDSASGSLLY